MLKKDVFLFFQPDQSNLNLVQFFLNGMIDNAGGRSLSFSCSLLPRINVHHVHYSVSNYFPGHKIMDNKYKRNFKVKVRPTKYIYIYIGLSCYYVHCKDIKYCFTPSPEFIHAKC